ANLHIRGPRWFDGVRVNGAMLSSVGLKSPVLKPEQAILIEAARV
ncbi:MAG: hypothetical protein RLZZ626_657, partial [Actinomycetota bacterium]